MCATGLYLCSCEETFTYFEPCPLMPLAVGFCGLWPVVRLQTKPGQQKAGDMERYCTFTRATLNTCTIFLLRWTCFTVETLLYNNNKSRQLNFHLDRIQETKGKKVRVTHKFPSGRADLTCVNTISQVYICEEDFRHRHSTTNMGPPSWMNRQTN